MSYLQSVLQPWYKNQFPLVTQPLSKFLKTLSVSEHGDEDHSGVSDHVPKGNFVIPRKVAKKKRERKRDIYLGNDVERRNVLIFSCSSVSSPRLFLALFKAVAILTCWHHSLLGIHFWEIKKSVWVWYDPENPQSTSRRLLRSKLWHLITLVLIIHTLKEILKVSCFNLNVGGCF